MERKDIAKLTLEEKCYFLSGANNWNTRELKKIGLKSILMTDGPYGIRKVLKGSGIGGEQSVKATGFPTSVVLGSTFNKELAYRFGHALGEEAKHYNIDIVLGPGICIKRSPLCGRNFEYISEDPYVSGFIASEYIKGVQENGVGCSLKHFACNNQETYRSIIDAVVDERTLREIYLKGFEIAVKNSQPMSIMTSYNKINGVFSSDNKWLLTDLARNEWGFKGFFVSDWGGCSHRDLSLLAGEDLEMPCSGKKAPELLIQAVNDGKIDESVINERVFCLANSLIKAQERRVKKYECDFEKNHQVAKAVSDEGMVLLKNERNILPLKREEKILFVGDFLNFDKFQASGSSTVNAINVVGVKKVIGKNGNVIYASGYSVNEKGLSSQLLNECIVKAKEVKKVVLFMGLGELDESESYDRKNINLPKNQIALLDKIYEVNKNIVVVLINGSPVAMPFIKKVDGILEAYLGGEAYGESIIDILYGKVNPSGRLAESFPISIKDTPCYKYFPGGSNASYYKESLFVGYRYYSSFKKPTLFPFGFGLSYSKFQYRNINIVLKNDKVSISCKVKNISKIDGKEVVQIYVGGPRTTVYKPIKELKDFTKISLKAGEEKQVYIEIPFENLKYYNFKEHRWVLESGTYIIYVGGDSEHSMLVKEFYIQSNERIESPYYRSQIISYFNGKIKKVPNHEFEIICGHKLPKLNLSRFKITDNHCFRTCRGNLLGWIVYRIINSRKELKKNPFSLEIALTTPFRQMFLFSGDNISYEEQKAILKVMNGCIRIKYIKIFINALKKIAGVQ
jgi:beta-glucosidase